MGKDLKGKELGRGLSQRRDGRYSARIMIDGRRYAGYFHNLREARRWLTNTSYEIDNAKKGILPKLTLDQYFEHWIKHEKQGVVKKNTILHYQSRYIHNIREEIGNMYLGDVKPYHCQKVLDKMEALDYAPSTIHQVRTILHTLFRSAAEDEYIERNPVKSKVRGKPYKTRERRVLTIGEQKKLLEEALHSPLYYEFALILQTGMRVGELEGLKWSDIDFDQKEIHINRTAHFYPDEHKFTFDLPKSHASLRSIPINEECSQLLQKLRAVKAPRSQGSSNLIFTGADGLPVHDAKYNYELKRIASKCNITGISMHCLRHTFATRCIEAGIRPKTLQAILGHTKLSTTMDLYVHVSDDSLHQEITKLDQLNQTIV